MKTTPKRREILIPGFKFLNFFMLTHVCGVVRGSLLIFHMVRSTLLKNELLGTASLGF